MRVRVRVRAEETDLPVAFPLRSVWHIRSVCHADRFSAVCVRLSLSLSVSLSEEESSQASAHALTDALCATRTQAWLGRGERARFRCGGDPTLAWAVVVVR